MSKYDIRKDRKYSKTHEWVKVDGDIATIGITDFAVDALGGITNIELSVETEDPKVRNPLERGIKVKKGMSIAVIDTAKATEEVYTQVTGEVVDVNTNVEDDPELVESSPYDDGWFIKVRIEDHAELDELMTPEEYEEHVKKEAEELGLS
ncbi:MAG: glycine cleavage system protein GcvH [Candidatus Asgardarchaeia archaeon]